MPDNPNANKPSTQPRTITGTRRNCHAEKSEGADTARQAKDMTKTPLARNVNVGEFYRK